MATILVVDDRAINREYLSSLLQYKDHHVVEASDGEEAYSIIEKIHPDLIITDIIMPKLSGNQLVEKLQKNDELARIPVIFYTATHQVEEAAAVAAKLGVKYLISKPSEPELIIQLVDKIFQNDKMDKQEIADLSQESSKVINNRLTGWVGNMNEYSDLIKNFLKHTDELIEERKNLLKMSQMVPNTYNELIKVTGRLFLLIEFNLDYSKEMTINEIIHFFCGSAKKIMISKNCFFGILNSQENDFSSYFINGNKDNSRIPINFKKFIEHFSKQKVMVSNDLEKNLAFIKNPIIQRNIITLKIEIGNNQSGYVFFSDKLDETNFTELDVEIATVLASQLALRYENLILKSSDSLRA